MDCGDLERQLDAYLDQELRAEQAAAVGEHLRSCAACSRQLAAKESLGRLVRQAPYY